MGGDKKLFRIIIVGAGPSGLVLGILLAKAGIQVQLLEQSATLDTNPRAAHYAPSSVRVLRQCGVLEKVQAAGYMPQGVCWRTPEGEILAGISPDPSYEDAMVCLPLDNLLVILRIEFEAQEAAQLRFNHEVIDIEQDSEHAMVKVETDTGTIMLEADYVVGCDGANSRVRKVLYGDEFPGETLASQIIATNVYYDLHKFNYWDSQFIVHPKNWYLAAKITLDGLWRVTYGDIPGLTNEEYLRRQAQRFEEILPGSPRPNDYRIANISPYKLHQRCVPSMRVGRVLLAADAAHLCNPFGGLGLTGGIADISSLYDCFLGIHQCLTDDSILDKWSESRIRKWKEIIDPGSRANFRRLWDSEVLEERESFFEKCRGITGGGEGRKAYRIATYMLDEDMSQYFRKPAP